jgi:hypothetical protein
MPSPVKTTITMEGLAGGWIAEVEILGSGSMLVAPLARLRDATFEGIMDQVYTYYRKACPDDPEPPKPVELPPIQPVAPPPKMVTSRRERGVGYERKPSRGATA